MKKIFRIVVACASVAAAAAEAFAAGPKLSVFQVHVEEMARQRGVPVEEAIKAVRGWGIAGADLMYDEKQLASNAKMLAGGLKPATVIVFMDLAHTNDVPKTEAVVAYAKRVGSPRIMLVPGYKNEGESRDAAWAAMKPNLAAFLACAEKAGLEVDFEDFDWNAAVVGSRAHMREAFAAFPTLGHVLDTGNYLYWRDDVLAAQREFAARIRHVHVKDRALDGSMRSVAAGTGLMPVATVVSRLRASGYAGWLTVECFGSTNMWDDVRTSAAFLSRPSAGVDYPERRDGAGLASGVAEAPELEEVRAKADRYATMSEGERSAAEKKIVGRAMRELAELELFPPRIVTGDVPKRYRRANLDFAMNGGAAVTPGGRVWSCWMAGGDNQKAHVVGAWSDDGGRTWSDVKFVVDPHFPEDRVGFAKVARNSLIANLWVLDDGKLRLTVFQSLDNWIGRGGTWEFVCADPDAAEPTWSAPRYLFPGSVHNKPTRLKDGFWLYPNDYEPYGAEWHPELDAFMGCGTYSVKDGAIVMRGGFVRPEGTRRGGQRHWAEHAIVERKDGALWMLVRTALGVQECFSWDLGTTWTKPKPTTAIKNCIARFAFIKLASGNLLLVKNGERVDVATCGDEPANGPRRALSAFVSEDDGKTWKGPLVLDARDEVAYPDAFQFPDGSVGVTYDHCRDRPGKAEICFVRFREDDVLQGSHPVAR